MWGSNAAGQRKDEAGQERKATTSKNSLDEQGGTFKTKNNRQRSAKSKTFGFVFPSGIAVKRSNGRKEVRGYISVSLQS